MSDAQRLAVSFNLQPVEDAEASAREGRPIFRDVEYVEIHVPGDPTNIPHRPVTDEDRVRFKPVYDAWKAGQGNVHDGQPLKEWPAIRPAEVKTLAHANVHTVEQLAALSDDSISRVGPVRHLVEKAKQYLDRSKREAPVAELQAQNVELQKQLAAIQEQMAQLRTTPRADEPKARRGPKSDTKEE